MCGSPAILRFLLKKKTLFPIAIHTQTGMLFGQHFDGEAPRNLNHVFLRTFENGFNLASLCSETKMTEPPQQKRKSEAEALLVLFKAYLHAKPRQTYLQWKPVRWHWTNYKEGRNDSDCDQQWRNALYLHASTCPVSKLPWALPLSKPKKRRERWVCLPLKKFILRIYMQLKFSPTAKVEDQFC